MAKRSRRKRKAPIGSTREKGDIVELIIANMHQTPGVVVERNVFLPTQDGSQRTREIDVLLTSQVAGYPVRVAIECKNEKRPIGVQKIDEFIGKLNDVGIPTQQGIYVSASRYTSGAIPRAEKVGIRPLILKELESDDLHQAIGEAFQSIIYLLLTITNIQVRNDCAETPTPQQMALLYDGDRKFCGSIPDLVWKEWVEKKLPVNLGCHSFELEIIKNIYQIINENFIQVYGIEVEIQITAHVIRISGKASQHNLVHASSEKIERSSIKASFEKPFGSIAVNTFLNEEDLQKFINSQKGITVTTRFVLPRIRLGAMYWPPSHETAQKVVTLMTAFAEGKIDDPRPFNLEEIEGSDMSAIWEPIWDEFKNHPFFKEEAS